METIIVAIPIGYGNANGVLTGMFNCETFIKKLAQYLR